jgi:hypothetical protein
MIQVRRLWADWTRFWFQSFSSSRWKLFRAVICSIMFVAYAIRHGSLEQLYSATRGVYIADPSQYVTMAYRWNLFSSLLVGPLAEWLIPLLHGLYLIALLMLIFGLLPRLVSVAAFVLHVSFIHANIGAVYGVDLIFTFYLFFFCLASDQVQPGESRLRAWLSSLAFRFAQIQLCIIYAFSGWEKLKGAPWWNGDALWSVIANPQLARFDFTWLAHFPLVLVLAAYLTLIWEMYFPVLVWLPRLRLPVLFLGVLFHLSILGMMKLAFFGLLMISTYVLFLTDREVAFVWDRLRQLFAFVLPRRAGRTVTIKTLLAKNVDLEKF